MKARIKINPIEFKRLYYRENISAMDMAKYYGCSDTTIRNFLKKHDFRVKRISEVMTGRALSLEHRAKVMKNLRNYQGGRV